MNVRFDHLSLSAKDPEGIRDFLIDLLGFEIGTRPNLSFNGYFLFSDGKDLVHIFRQAPVPQQNSFQPNNSSEQNIVHHVCFFTDNYKEVLNRIEKLSLHYSMNTVPDTHTKQIFVRGPEGLIVEIQAVP
ncbi:VOC family protein [Pseudocolwellia agarivorans]|uniref:VOC family protein n=1 Tax=Pseudocolwellia agarivorans TaxID=1911682 RepID=UPI0009850D2C|nr:VOC family protein [Pseudocolwellia agarivorans]